MLDNNFLIVTIITNLLIIIFFRQITNHFNILDYPDKKRKFQKKPIYLIGGTFLFFNIILFSISNYLINDFFLKEFTNNRENFAFIFGLLAFYFFGLYDDKYDLSPNSKLIIPIIIILFILYIDNNLLIKNLDFSFLKSNIELRSFSLIFTVLCFLLFVNALNMFDGINLQVTSYSILFLIIFIFKGLFIDLCLAVIISLFVILYYNSRNKIFLGESGIQLIAFLITFIILKSTNSNTTTLYADEIFLIMSIPGLDMFRLFLMRLVKGRHPFKPDNFHLHHLLGKIFSKLQTFIFTFSFISLSIILYYYIQYKLVYIVFWILFYFLTVLFLLNYKKK